MVRILSTDSSITCAFERRNNLAKRSILSRVLDGLLYNESELEIEEHYTDTHGYTEINFAAFAMLGLRFCPRIRGVQHQRIYRIDPNRDYGSLASLIKRADQSIDTEQIAEHWDRMGQLYASLKTGHVTASVALKRLVGFSAKNRFYRANRDLGRIFKTEFILQYLSSRNCADASGAACSRSSNSTPWPETSFTGDAAGSTPASCGSR